MKHIDPIHVDRGDLFWSNTIRVALIPLHCPGTTHQPTPSECVTCGILVCVHKDNAEANYAKHLKITKEPKPEWFKWRMT